MSKMGHLTHNQRQLAVVGFAESKTHSRGIQGFYRSARAIVEAVLRVALVDQSFEGPRDIFGGDWGAVMPARLRANMKDHPGAVTRPLNGFGNQAVAGKWLVSAGDEERFYRTGADRVTLGDEGVKTVKKIVVKGP